MARLGRVVGMSLVAGAGAEALLHAAPQILPPALQATLGVGPYGRRSGQGFYETWHALAVVDPLTGYRYAPSLDVWLSGHPDFAYRLRTNSRGLRTPHEHGPVDVVAIGDSFTFGYGVDEAQTWPVRLAGLTGLQVANLGVSGYGPQSELALLRSDGLALRPKLVLWQFFANDPEDASIFAGWQRSGDPDLYRWQRRARPGQPAATPARPAGSSLRAWLHHHVRSYELAKYALGLGGYAPGGYPAWVRVGDVALLLNLAGAARWADFSRPEIRDGWQLATGCLLEARQAALAAGATFAVLLAPSKEQTYRGRLRVRQSRAAGDPGDCHRRMVQWCREQGIPCLDLAPAFAEAGQSGQALYFSTDAHWNDAGHALAAQQVARFVQTFERQSGDHKR